METLSSVLKVPQAVELEEVIAHKAASPIFTQLYQPDQALRYIQNNVCLSYLFARFTIPTYVSEVFSFLRTMNPVDDQLGPLLEGVVEMAQGELFNNNIYLRPTESHSHYHDVVEAFTAAGGSKQLVDDFIKLEQKFGFPKAIDNSTLWSKWSVRYATRSLLCYGDPLAMFILIPTTEELSPKICQRALDNLCTDSSFDKFRTFLQKHVSLDQDEHGPITLRWLETYIQKTGHGPEQIEKSVSKVLYLLTGA